MINKRKQNRVLYICLIILLVTASVLIALASASNKTRVGPDDGKNTLNEVKEPSAPFVSEKSGEDDKEDEKKGSGTESKKTSAEDEPMQSASVTVDDISFVAPVNGGVISEFSLAVPVYSITMNDYRTHNGVDIVTDTAAPVRACADGQVVSMGYDPMMGMSVRIAHGGGAESVYRNLAEELSGGLTVGSRVKAGDVIGAVGGTALVECEEEPHLHFELAVDGKNVDPLEYVDVPLVSDSYED